VAFVNPSVAVDFVCLGVVRRHIVDGTKGSVRADGDEDLFGSTDRGRSVAGVHVRQAITDFRQIDTIVAQPHC
jgi:hypothetical protein